MASQATLAVLLTLKDDLSSGLKNAAKEASGFGGVLKGLGVGIASVATAAVAAGVASVKSFADTGDALKEMAQKTGFSTESLSTLKYAAEQCGASLDTIGVAVRGVAGFMQHRSPFFVTWTGDQASPKIFQSSGRPGSSRTPPSR